VVSPVNRGLRKQRSVGDWIYKTPRRTLARLGLPIRRVARIQIDPRKHDTVSVFATAMPSRERRARVFRTTDVGLTWQKLLYSTRYRLRGSGNRFA